MNVTSSTPGRNVLSFKLSGSEKMRIASDGSVGIGTAAPATTLDVSGTTTLKGTTNLSNNNIINIGNAGIGTAAPAYKLDVIGSGSDSIVCRLQSGGANTATTYVNTGASNLDVGTGSGGHFIYGYGSYPLYFGVNGSEKMRITESGNVGIGTSTPNAPLQLAKTIVNRKIVLWEDWNNEHQYYGFGVNSAVLRYQTSGGDHVFYSGTSSTSSTELMRITSAGRVGIGTSTPRFPLEVTRYVYGKYNDNGPTVMSINNSYLTSGSVNNNISISADYWIAAANFAGYSDKRIKKNIQSLQTDKCIKMIRELNPVSYNYIDYVSKSTSEMYGFIAQEVINHVSPAISYKSDYIPNLYSHVKLSKYDDNTNKSLWKVTLNKSYTETGVFTFYANKDNSGNEYIGSDRYPLSDKEGNQRFKIKIIDYNLTTENEIICYTEKIINDTEFLINAESINNEYNSETIKKYNFEEKEYFLYGQEVDDFHILTYDFVWTVFASSVKEIDRQQQADKVRIAELETEIVSLKQELDKQKTLINSILERLAI